MSEIIKGGKKFDGCDFVLRLDSDRKNTKIKLLQITDMQVIDSLQRRTPERLRIDEINSWKPENFDALCGKQIRSLVVQTKPDLIFITGDIIYGSFDDKGSTLEWFCGLMDSLEIPWAPVFGNHDNESAKGVKWQCEQFEKSKYCVFARGNVSGNSNYTVGIAVDDELVRVLHMLDSNGCTDCDHADVIKTAGIYPDQIEWIKENTRRITEIHKKKIPAFASFHIATEEFITAEEAKGYKTADRDFYIIGVDVPAVGDDFGCKLEKYSGIKVEGSFLEILKECNIDGVFAGHCHKINTCIDYEGIKWVFGLKTGQYDYHTPGQNGGTLVTLEGDAFEVQHIPALVPYAPFPGNAPMFKDFFAEDKFIL